MNITDTEIITLGIAGAVIAAWLFPPDGPLVIGGRFVGFCIGVIFLLISVYGMCTN